MALNLTPQYHDADARYRAARSPEEKLAALEEMWRELPKHKASEKMQAELKKKLSAARHDLQKGEHKHAGKVDPFAIPRGGAGQIAILGTPNSGKSSIVGGLTNAQVRIAEFPFSTPLPLPGMAAFEDVKIQLIDTPPITAEHVPPGSAGLWHSADALLVVVDLAADSLLEDAETCLNHLAERRIELTDGPRCLPDELGGPLRAPGLLIGNKLDLAGASDNLGTLRELFGTRAPIHALSTRDAVQMAALPAILFGLLGVIRVYAKPPGKKPDLEEPFILRSGSDIHEMARKVHRDLAQHVKSARLWGHGGADGRNVHLDHVLHDKDIVELHA